ncbi:acyl-CoA dehydrogenase family protein [Nocardia sp. NPDC050406]|uniref:acyl-CoA dehydrogenase family protein n=1 Tax=Nocardia sp. NPDC050406 TaxID=3364318 RepID=UPI0037A30565
MNHATETPPLFEFTDEHRALREMLRQRFETAYTGWRELADEAGIEDLLFGDEHSEFRGSAIDLAILAEEAGAALYGGPVVSMAVASALADAAGDAGWPNPAGARTPLAAVDARLFGTRSSAGPELRGTAATPWLSGRIEPVWDIDGAELIVCTATDSADGSPAVAVLPADTDAVTVTPLSGLDLSRRVGRVDCAEVEPLRVLRDDAARRALAAMRARADLVLAAESLGVARHALDRTIEYVGGRVQFGRSIGSFQAVKHRLADLLAQVELTRSAVYGAAWALTTAPDAPDTEIDLAVAASLATDTAVTVTKATVQLHGGIAITWEHWAHRYLRRAHAVAAQTGGAPHYRRRLATLVDDRDGRS